MSKRTQLAILIAIVVVCCFLLGMESRQFTEPIPQQKPSPYHFSNPVMSTDPFKFDLPGTPNWYEALPPIPPCRQLWELQCKRVLNSI